MTEPTSKIDTSKKASEMTPAERQAFLDQCRKLATASSKPVEHPAPTASAQERAAWLENYKRSLR
jgi:hypothetical protein